MNGAHGGGVGVGSLVAHHAHAHHRQQDGKALPDRVVKPGGLDLGDDDLVGLLQQRHAFRRHFAQNAHGEAGAGKRLATQNLVRHFQVTADAPDFIFEQIAQRLNQLELHPQRQPTHVVVALDGLARSLHAAGLDHVGVERALNEPVHTAGFFGDARCLVVEDGDELRADDFSLFLRLRHSCELAQETLARVHGNDLQAKFFAQIFLDVDEFVLAQNAVVDEDARQLISDGAMHQHRRHRRIHATGEAADDVPAADLLANRGHGGFDKACRGPVAACPADVKDKVSDDLRPQGRVMNLGVKLHRPDAALCIFNSCQCVGGDSDATEADGQLQRFVAVAHPDSQRLR